MFRVKKQEVWNFLPLFAVFGSSHMKATFLRNRIEPYSTLLLQNFQQPNSITQNNKFQILWTHDNNSTQHQHSCNSMNMHVQSNYKYMQ